MAVLFMGVGQAPIRRRLMLRALGQINGGAYPPRRGPVAALIAGLAEGQAATLAGCQALLRRGEIWIFREYNAVRDLRVPADQLWDGRWRAIPPEGLPPEAALRALGPEGRAQCPGWRSLGRLRSALLSTAASYSIEEVAEAAPGNLWFQLYLFRDPGLRGAVVERAREAGYRALVVTVDLARGGKREKDLRNGFTVPVRWRPHNAVDFATHPRWALRMLPRGPAV